MSERRGKMKLRSIEAEAAACRKAFKGVGVGALVWHCHHLALAESLTEPPENRIAYILRDKPEAEQALRLRLFRPVVGKLPAEVVKACAARVKARAAYDEAWAAYDEAIAAYDEARAAYDEARAACDEARAARDEAIADHRTEIEALHATECPGCPWNGHTIFQHGAP